MIEIFLVLFVVVIVVTLCIHHHSMKTKLYESSDCDARLALKADQNSIRASNSTNELTAIIDITQAIQILECLLERHSASTASELAGVNVSHMLKTFTEQRNKIFESMVKKYPGLKPKRPLATFAMPKEENEDSATESDSSTDSEEDLRRRTERYRR